MNETTIENIAEIIKVHGNVVALTGAGISVESGIAPFRGPGGLWEKYNVEEYATLDVFLDNPVKAWELFKVLGEGVVKAKPNPAHIALAQLQQKGYLTSIITQNVDGLHQKAGNTNVIEFHGTHSEYICIKCNSVHPETKVNLAEIPPLCSCGYPLKPNVILFGELIPPAALVESQRQSEQCHIMLVIGTSAQIYPASHMPVIAKQNGAYVFEINAEVTPLTGYVSDGIILGQAGDILPRLVELV